jgi:hypothetical protein
MSEQESEVQEFTQRDRRNLYITLGVLGVSSIILIVALAIVLFVDPFGWDLLGLGRADAALQAMPQETMIYLRFDLSKAKDERLDSLAWVFSEELKEEGKSAIEGLIEELDNELEEELGLTFSEDVQPWIASDVGFGLYGLTMSSYGSLESAEFALAVETRDPDAADEFLVKLSDAIRDEMGEVVLEEQVQNVLVYVVDATTEGDRLAFCRSGDLVIFSMDLDGIETVLNAQSGTSLAEKDAYQDALKELPRDYLLTFYIDMEEYLRLMPDELMGLYGSGFTQLYGDTIAGVQAVSGGVTVEDEGIRLDLARIGDAEIMSQVAQYFNMQPRTADMASEDTLFYLVGGELNQQVERMKESLEGLPGGMDIEEAMMFFKMSYGFDPFEDLLSKLDGEFALIMNPSSEGILAEEVDVPLSFVFVAETSDAEALLDVSASFSSALELQGSGEAEFRNYEHTQLYELVDVYSGNPIATYGVGEEHFLVGSSPTTVNSLFEEKEPLSESDRYRDVWRAFPKDMAPALYVDIQNIVANIREGMTPDARERFDQDEGKIWKAMQFFAAANTSVADGVARSTMILFIETE